MKRLSLSLSLLPLLAATAFGQQNPPLTGDAPAPHRFGPPPLASSDLFPPDSAVQIAGTNGSPWGWLNEANAAVSLNDALTSNPIVPQAWANAPVDLIVEVTFTAGVTNNAGDDLAMLDAQFDAGIYIISTDYDGFAASLTIDTTGAPICGSANYYYEHNASGPFPADVHEARFDLSSLGVPAGATVNRVRFASANSGCDPVCLAKISSAFTLTVSQLTAGQLGTVTASNGTPLSPIGIGYSLTGGGPTSLSFGSCGTLTVDLSAPIKRLAVANSDGTGTLSVSKTLPGNTSGLQIWFQALDLASCTLSNGVAVTVQ